MVLADKEMLANSQHPDPDSAMITAGFSERMADKGRRKKQKVISRKHLMIKTCPKKSSQNTVAV